MVSLLDVDSKLIYLDVSTVNSSINPIAIYQDIRELRKNNESYRKFDMPISGFGNIPKGGGKSTERYFRLNNGWRIVPYDISHILTITGTLITDDGNEGVACFNRFPLSIGVEVDIQYVPPQVEIITVATGSGVTAQDKTDIVNQVWANAVRTLTSAGAGGATAQEVWEYGNRSLTAGSGLDETQLHTALDSYTNKTEWKADVSNLSADVNVVEVAGTPITSITSFQTDLGAVTSRLDALNDVSVADIEASTVLAKEASLDNTPVLDAISNLNDITVSEVRAAFNALDFQAKNTESEIHAWLDSYVNKKNWGQDVSTAVANVQTVVDSINADTVSVLSKSYTETELHQVLDSYVNKDNWKSSTVDYTARLDGIDAAIEEVHAFVDGLPAGQSAILTEVTGLGVDSQTIADAVWSSTNRKLTEGFNTVDRTKLNSLSNYDDSGINTKLDVLTTNDSNLEGTLHTALDSYANKDDWKAIVDLTPIINVVESLNNLSLLDIEGSTVLAKEATLGVIVSNIAQIPTTDSVADITPVLNAIAGLNDVTPAEVRSAFDSADFKDKNTELEVHTWLDSYANKSAWKDGSTLADTERDAIRDKIWDKVV